MQGCRSGRQRCRDCRRPRGWSPAAGHPATTRRWCCCRRRSPPGPSGTKPGRGWRTLPPGDIEPPVHDGSSAPGI